MRKWSVSLLCIQLCLFFIHCEVGFSRIVMVFYKGEYLCSISAIAILFALLHLLVGIKVFIKHKLWALGVLVFSMMMIMGELYLVCRNVKEDEMEDNSPSTIVMLPFGITVQGVINSERDIQ